MVIGLVLSLSFVPSILAMPTDKFNNSTDLTNSDNILEVNLTGKIPYVNSPSGLGDEGGVDLPWMDKPEWGKSEVWKSFMKWFNEKGKDKWYNAWHFWYYIAYPCALIAETTIYGVLLIGWFFACIAWVFYAIPVTLIKIADFGKSFYLIGWCYYVFNEVKVKDVSKIINVNNSTKSLKNTNMSNMAILNNTNMSNTTMLNDTNVTLFNETNEFSTLLNNTEFNLTEYLISNHYSSGSNNKYENVSNTNINNGINGFKKQGTSIKNTFKIINGILEGVSNIISLVELITKIVTAVAAAVAAVPGGQGAPATGVGAQAAQITFDESLNFASDLIEKDIKETLLTKLTTTVAEQFDKKNTETEGELGTFVIEKLEEKLEDLVESIEKDNEKSEKDNEKRPFDHICDLLKLLTLTSELVYDIFADIQTIDLQEELDYRTDHNLTVI
jgi:hypothetical protein